MVKKVCEMYLVVLMKVDVNVDWVVKVLNEAYETRVKNSASVKMVNVVYVYVIKVKE